MYDHLPSKTRHFAMCNKWSSVRGDVRFQSDHLMVRQVVRKFAPGDVVYGKNQEEDDGGDDGQARLFPVSSYETNGEKSRLTTDG